MTSKALLHGAKDVKLGEIGNYFSLQAWCDEEKIGYKDDSRKGAKDAKNEQN